MPRKLHCAKLGIEGHALARPPYPGPLGERIFASISQQAWDAWLAHQTTLINEYRLNPLDPKARTFLEDHMQAYFFGEGSEKPAGFTEIDNDASA